MSRVGLVILIVLTGCSAERRCQQHLKRATALGCLSMDTFYRKDTIKAWNYDTTFVSDTLTLVDTFEVINGTERIRTVVKWKDRTIYQEKIQKDTVLVTPINNTTIIQTNKHSHIKYWAAIALLIILLVGSLYQRR